MADVKPGDEVRVHPFNRSRRAQNPEGFPGKVTKVGKKYGTAEFTEPPDREWSIRFDLESGLQSPATEGFMVRTLKQIEQMERRKVALFALMEAGVELTAACERNLPLEQVESLAEVVKTWDQEADR